MDWKVLQITYKPHRTHPGSYVLTWTEPMKSGSLGLFKEVDNKRLAASDEYDKQILDMLKQVPRGFELVAGKKEASLVAWEMFVYGHDGMLVDFLRSSEGRHVQDWLLDSIDVEQEAESRYDAYEKVLAMASKHPHRFRDWFGHMLKMLDNYSDWLVEVHRAHV